MENISRQLGEVQNNIGNVEKEINDYVKFIREKKFEYHETEDLEKSIENAEGVLDQLLEVNERKQCWNAIKT